MIKVTTQQKVWLLLLSILVLTISIFTTFQTFLTILVLSLTLFMLLIDQSKLNFILHIIKSFFALLTKGEYWFKQIIKKRLFSGRNDQRRDIFQISLIFQSISLALIMLVVIIYFFGVLCFLISFTLAAFLIWLSFDQKNLAFTEVLLSIGLHLIFEFQDFQKFTQRRQIINYNCEILMLGLSRQKQSIFRETYLIENYNFSNMLYFKSNIDNSQSKLSLLFKTFNVQINEQNCQKQFKQSFGISPSKSILIFYDVTSIESYNQIEKWLNFAKSSINLDGIIVMIVGIEIQQQNHRKVSHDQCIQAYQKYGYICCEISIETGDQFEEMVQKLASKISQNDEKNEKQKRLEEGKQMNWHFEQKLEESRFIDMQHQFHDNISL